MPNGGLPNCHECMHSKSDVCGVYGVKTSPYLLCSHYKHWNHDVAFDDHIKEYLEPFQLGTVYWIDNMYGATQERPLPAYKMLHVRHEDARGV